MQAEAFARELVVVLLELDLQSSTAHQQLAVVRCS